MVGAPLPPRGDHVLVAPTRDSSRVGWSATLRVDEDNAFFFDHPLDHIPGMLVLEAGIRMAELSAQAAGPGRAARQFPVTEASLEFTKLSEKDEPLWIQAAPDPDNGGLRRRLRMTQGGVSRCSGTIELAPPACDRGSPAPGSPAGRGVPAPPALVHKQRTEAVLVGSLVREGGAEWSAVLPLSPEYRLGIHPATVLAETARQFSILTSHIIGEVPLDWTFILTSLRLSLASVPTGAEPLYLRSHGSPIAGRKLRHAIEIHDGVRALGSVGIGGLLAPRTVYARLRRAGRI